MLVNGREGGKPCGAEELDIGEVDRDPFGLGGMSQRVLGELGCVDGVDFALGADHRR